MKRFVSLTAVLLALASFLTGCATNVPPADTADTTPTTDSTEPLVPPAEDLSIVLNGKSEYKVIRPEKTSAMIIDALSDLRDAVKLRLNVELEPATDWERGYSTENPFTTDAAEILIGNTNRKESQDVLATLKKGEYCSRVVGNKLVIIGYTDTLTALAVADFISKQLASPAESLKLPLDFSITGQQKLTTIGDTDATLRVMTFNVLADDTVSARATLIADTVNTYEPDVVCFQECNSTHHKNALMLLKNSNYQITTEKHPGTNTYVYTPILYRTDKLKLIESGVEWNDGRWPYTNTKSIAWAVFESIESSEKFSVVNIHGSLWSNGYDPAKMGEGKTHQQMYAEAELWRQDNVRQMNDRMNAIEKTYGDIPCIWTGDFNFNENSQPYKNTVELYGMTSAEKAATVSKMTGATYHSKPGQAPDPAGLSIDHIFGNSHIVFRVHQICKLDTEVQASDHCAVFADMKFGD